MTVSLDFIFKIGGYLFLKWVSKSAEWGGELKLDVKQNIVNKKLPHSHIKNKPICYDSKFK